MVNLTLFSQITGKLDRAILSKLVKEKDTDKYSKGFSSWDCDRVFSLDKSKTYAPKAF